MTQRPTGVTVISILYFIGAAGLLLLAALMIAGTAFIGVVLSEAPELQEFGAMLGIILIVGAVFFVLLAILYTVLGIYLLKLRNWARITALILTSLGGLLQLISLLGSIILLVANPIEGIIMLTIDLIGLSITGLIIWYLGFNKEVQQAFNPQTLSQSATPPEGESV